MAADKREPESEGNSTEEVSFADLVKSALLKLKTLSESNLVSEKLMAIDAVLFSMVLSVLITHSMINPDSPMKIDSLVIFLLFLCISIIGTSLYLPLLEIMTNFSRNRINTLGMSVLILILTMPVAVAGFSFSETMVIKIAMGMVALHFAVILAGILLVLPNLGGSSQTTETSGIWEVLGKVGIICSIVSLIITIVVPIL